MRIIMRGTIIVFLLLLSLYSCAGIKSGIFQEKLPTIAHVHIGHAITSWKTTPDKKGLLVVAEEEAAIALSESEKAVAKPEDLKLIQKHVGYAMNAIDPGSYKVGPGLGFGLKRALSESINHITFAAQSDDASPNVKAFAPRYATAAEATISRCDLILALGREVLETPSATEASALAEEILTLSRANVSGSQKKNTRDVNKYGLKQIRRELTAMIDRENPPYQPVAQRYLLGIIRLPSGKWTFSWLVDPFYDDVQAGGGGGGGGGAGGY